FGGSQRYANGTVLPLPITDNAIFPGIAGPAADGYDLRLFPAILDIDNIGSSALSRDEFSGITEVSSGTKSIIFLWPVEQVRITLLDQNGQPVTGTNGNPSRFAFFGDSRRYANGSVLPLPITDNTLFPGIAGAAADGYDLVLFPAVLDID